MKFRKDFVTNSSSSSFICEVCGQESESGYNMSAIELGMLECDNGHTLCRYHIKDEVRKKYKISEFGEGAHIKSEDCPVCQLKCMPIKDIFNLLTLSYNKKKNTKRLTILNALEAEVESGIFMHDLYEAYKMDSLTCDDIRQDTKYKIRRYDKSELR